MGQRAPAPVASTDDVLRAVAAQASEHARSWFPEFAGRRIQTHLISHEKRPRCLLYRARIGDGRTSRDVVVKIRHSIPELRRLDPLEARRPVLTPERTLPDRQTARREYDGLQLVEQLFRGADSQRFAVLRPLAWLAEHPAIVMDHVPEPTLYRVFESQSRFRARPLVPPQDARPWANAGKWLRIFHRAESSLEIGERAVSRDAVVDLYPGYADFLGDTVGDRRFFTELADVAIEQATATLPIRLPLGLGHGDYTMRNVFTSLTGRVVVFDPMPLWRVPVYEDLARFVIGFRILNLQAATRGAAYSRPQLDRAEAAFLRGYFGEEPVPQDAVRLYQLLLLLDKWAGRVGKQDRRSGLRRRWRALRVQVSDQHYRTETRRLMTPLG